MTTIAAYMEAYIERVSYEWRPATLRKYRGLVAQNIAPYIGGLKLSAFRKAEFDVLMSKLLVGKRLSTRSVNATIWLLNRMFKDAYDNEVLNKLIQFDKLHRTEKKPVKAAPFTYAEILTVLTHVPQRYRPIILFIAYTGVRPNEAMGLKWGDVNLDKSVVTIERGIVNGVEGPTKTGIVRQIPLVPKLRKMLRRMGSSQKSRSFVFTRADGKRPIEGHLDRIWRDATAETDVEHRCLYTLRRSFISNALQSGVSINYVSKVAGHSSIQTTLVEYADYVDTGSVEPKKLLAAIAAASGGAA